MSQLASESGHWYTREGKPAYTIIGKNGKERNTTLADAKKIGLVPSTTTITKMAAAPGLEIWKQKQVLLATVTLPRRSEEPEEVWVSRVMEDSKQQGIMAAQRGTDIHTAIEKRLKGQEPDIELAPYADAAIAAVNEKYPGMKWNMERSFASSLGYGGKVDLFSDIGVVLDFKSKDGSLDKVKCWDEHFMQLASYSQGLGFTDAKCANVFITRTRPIEVKILEHSVEETVKGWRMFLALLEYYKAKNNL